MQEIKDIEKDLLREADYGPVCAEEVLNIARSKLKNRPKPEMLEICAKIIGSLEEQGFVKLMRSFYREDDEDEFEYISSSPLNKADRDDFVMHPENWLSTGVFSDDRPVEIEITDKGKEYLAGL